MIKVGKFDKVSFAQFNKDMTEEFKDRYTDDEIRQMYDNIKLPVRATQDSAGYDLFSPFDFTLKPNEVIKIPTGIRVFISGGWFLGCLPRSGLGFKFYESLANTFGIIDSGFVNSDNEGHIFAKIINRSPITKETMAAFPSTEDHYTMKINQGQGFMQGIFIQFGITIDDEADGIRNGGFGSTDKK